MILPEQSTVVVADPTIEDPRDATPWRNGTMITVFFFTGSLAFLFIALIASPIMTWELDELSDVDLAGLLIHNKTKITRSDGTEIPVLFNRKTGRPEEFEVKITYYGAKVIVDETDYNYGMDDATCEKKGLITFAAVLHYLTIVPAGTATALIWLELRSGKILSHALVVVQAIVCIMLFIYSIVMGVVRDKATWTECKTVMPNLDEYEVGPCWILVELALVGYFLGQILYISSRYMKCCCYTRPVVNDPTADTEMHAMAQPYPAQQQPVYAAQPVIGQPMYDPQQQQAAYPQQQQQQYQQPPPVAGGDGQPMKQQPEMWQQPPPSSSQQQQQNGSYGQHQGYDGQSYPPSSQPYGADSQSQPPASYGIREGEYGANYQDTSSRRPLREGEGV